MPDKLPNSETNYNRPITEERSIELDAAMFVLDTQIERINPQMYREENDLSEKTDEKQAA